MVFTPRLIERVWKTLSWQRLFWSNPDAPSAEAFLAHYAATDAGSKFSWSDRANKLTYLYDLSVNQAQVTPAAQPFDQWVEDASKRLWKLLPPKLLEGLSDWKPLWFEAANRVDLPSMEFILEQGFEVNTLDHRGRTALDYAVVPYEGHLEMVTLLVEHGVKLDDIERLIEECGKNHTSANEASTHMDITAYLRQKQKTLTLFR